MKISNKKDSEYLYKISNQGILNQDIYVTGSHLIFDKYNKKFIKVEDYNLATKTNIKLDWFCCLITDTHNIKIGKEIFWDWEDHFLKFNMIDNLEKPYFRN